MGLEMVRQDGQALPSHVPREPGGQPREGFEGGAVYVFRKSGGVWGEKRLLRGAPAAVRRVWLWLFVLSPAPLILNPALRRAFFL